MLPAEAVQGVVRVLGHMRPTSAEAARMERARTDSALVSPLADSLSALSGGGRPEAQADRFAGIRPAGTGQYNPVLDNVTLGHDEGTRGNRNTLIHEMGHRRNFRTRQGLSGIFDPAFAQGDEAEGKQYRETNRAEGYAVAFQEAFNLLDQFRRSPAPPSEDAVRRMLARREREVPGTTRLFNEMLAEPLYANHPLRQSHGIK